MTHTTEINGDLILEKDTKYYGDLIVHGDIYGKDGRRYDIDAYDIHAGNIDARNIDAGNIDAWDIDAYDIHARNIDAGDINARDINARDINAGNIDAWDINYYAVCFAYKNITCKSIEGERENCKHFVLDGEIKIIDDTKEEKRRKNK